MSPVKGGVLIAIVLAGPKLWSLVQTGELSGVAALERGTVVAAACVFGAIVIDNLITRYAIEQVRARRVARALASMDDIVHEGSPVRPGPGGGQPSEPEPDPDD